MRICLSEEAKRNLINAAYKQRFRGKKTQTGNFHNVGVYLEELTKCNFVDARPDYMREEAAELANYYLPSSWSTSSEPRYKTNCALSFAAKGRLLRLSLQFGIVNPRKDTANETSVIAAVIEAIGCGTLVANAPLPFGTVKQKDKHVRTRQT